MGKAKSVAKKARERSTPGASKARPASHKARRRRVSSDGALALWLFDFDNTLAQLEPCVDWAASRRELEPALRAAGVPEHLFEQHPRGNLLLYNALRWLFLSPHAAELDGSPAEQARPDPKWARAIIRKASAIIEKYELAGVDRAEPLPGALELIRALRAAGATVGVVTSNSSRTVARWLRRNRLTSAITTVVGRDSLLPLKPAPDMLKAALEKCGVPAADAAYVGDSEGDLVAARKAGLQFFAIAPTLASRDRMVTAGAERIFASPAALAIYLNLATPRATAPASSATTSTSSATASTSSATASTSSATASTTRATASTRKRVERHRAHSQSAQRPRCPRPRTVPTLNLSLTPCTPLQRTHVTRGRKLHNS